MALGLSKVLDGGPRSEKAPYTAVEGYLQRSIMKPVT